MKYIYILLFTISLLFAFGQTGTEMISYVSPVTKLKGSETYAIADTSKAVAVVMKMYHKNPKFISVKNVENKSVIIAVIADESSPWGNSTIYVLENTTDNWKEKFNLIIESGTFIENFEWITIENKELLYFDLIAAGGSMGNGGVVFGLYDFTISKYYHLDYYGMMRNDYKQIEGKFINIDSLKPFPEFLSLLENKADKSNKIYKPTLEDLNINHPRNAANKFQLDNPNLYSELKNHKGNYIPIVITKYSDEYAKIFQDNIGNRKSEFLGSIATQTSNKIYTVYSLFKDYVICYNKVKNFYFVVWVPDDTYRYVTKLDLTEGNILTLYDSGEKPEFVIDLNQVKIKCVSSKK